MAEHLNILSKHMVVNGEIGKEIYAYFLSDTGYEEEFWSIYKFFYSIEV